MDIREILNIDNPIIMGAMANITTGKFVADASNCGITGVIAGGFKTGEEIRKDIRECKERTNKPFGVNIMLKNPHVDEVVRAVIDENVNFVTTGAGNPKKYIESFKEKNIKIFPVVPNPKIAYKLVEEGIDGIIAEGTESGGHVGEMTTFVLISELAEKLNIPLIAAGGIASGKSMAAFSLLGANGFQIGTKFLVSEECPISINYKKAIINAQSTDIVVTGRIIGLPVRVIKNEMTNEYIRIEKDSKTEKNKLEELTMGSLKKAVINGDIVKGSLMAGQNVGMINKIEPLKKIIEDLMKEYKKYSVKEKIA